MRQKLLWLDLAICSIWVLTILGCKSWDIWPTLFFLIMRIVTSFVLYHKDKRSWLPLSCYMGLSALSPFLNLNLGISELSSYPFIILGLEHDMTVQIIVRFALLIWLWVMPVVVYIIERYQKVLKVSELTWKDTFGAILWNDRRAKTYCRLMLVAIGALYVGLAMDKRMCMFACVVLPALSYYILTKYYDIDNKRSWMIVVGMVIFFFAQRYAGIWRIGMLLISLTMVTYACRYTFGEKGLTGLSIITTIYLGILLPSTTIGNNQFACINYGRQGFYTLESFQGIFFIRDPKTGYFGLRDRYGILVEPEYEDIVYHTPNHYWGTLELRKNGYYTLYDICNNHMLKADDIDHQLQDSICLLLDKHHSHYCYDYNERIEVKVTETTHNDKLLSHIKMSKNGNTSYYDYQNKPYISSDTANLRSGEFAIDSLMYWGSNSQILHYSYDVTQNSTTLFNIDVKTARNTISEQKEIIELVERITELLKE